MFSFITLENGKRLLRILLATMVSYSNTTSGLTATDVQSAIDEIAATSSPDLSLDGGFANSVYTAEQCFDGGGA